MPTCLCSGLGFTEGLRWHRGRLWFSDFITHKVHAVDERGTLDTMAFVAGTPSGLGFLPDGTPLIVSMLDRRIVKLRDDELSNHADLRAFNTPPCNDMFVDARGHAYVGTFSYEFWYEAAPPVSSGVLLHIAPDGRAAVAAGDLRMPNGIALLPDNRTLVVAETHAQRLTAFTVSADGSLSNRRLYADLRADDIHPDGLCCDADGNIWVAGLYAGVFVQLNPQGRIQRIIEVPGRWAVSCALGDAMGDAPGDDLGGATGARLFCSVVTVQQPNDLKTGRATAAIEFVDL